MYQANPKESNIVAVKRIIRYVNVIGDYDISSFKDTNSSLGGYSDADWVGNDNDKKKHYWWLFLSWKRFGKAKSKTNT